MQTVRLLFKGSNQDEVSDIIVRAAHDNGTCANTYRRINLRELYKKSSNRSNEKYGVKLKSFDVNEEFNSVWDEDEFDMTSDEFMEILEEAQETFREKLNISHKI